MVQCHILTGTGRAPTNITGEYSIDFEVMPTGFELLNGHIMYILLQNGQSVTSATKVVRNLLNVEDVLSLKSPVLSVLVKYKSMLRSINRDFDKFVTYFKARFTVPSKPSRRNANESCNPNNMSNISDSMPEPPSVSITPGSPSVSRTPEPVITSKIKFNIKIVNTEEKKIDS